MQRLDKRKTSPYICARLLKKASSLHGVVAQLVEHRTENPGVAGSIPARTTILYLMIAVFAHTHHHYGLPS